ncbi:catalase/peroxidase HPI [Aureimonas jatrophae]|uniref:Catalase-peroxidase n=1 Tax=Aureimonas jatrophae TaxID=1166073 RepID=A0A1H0K1K9_9HYPH|nr:catalase/peroxidase HPI [Aureimonas jatrophae]MBB3950897.1 catalase-peroxidase [Aureimonas jatrophae]SDO49632.1 catalase-peroxidase [Aureimonas jatrophae]
MDTRLDDVGTGMCPFGGTRISGAAGTGPQIDHWWPNRLKVELLHQNPPAANPLRDHDYARAFEALDLEAVKGDIKSFLTSSVSWWPSDYGNYGPQMIRMAWHSAGTYRIADGRGGAGQGMQRFAPINSWWDNGNTDKSRRLLWPIKQRYGAALSWADLMVLTGNCALEIMGFRTFGFGGGRIDAWEPDRSTYWGPEGWDGKPVDEAPHGPKAGHPEEMVNRGLRWQGGPKDATYELDSPLGATHQSLIYVDPEGPNGNGDPLDSARDIRLSFGRMAMNDEETVALIAGGHAFGKSHGMVKADRIGGAPENSPIEAMGLGWHNPEGSGNAEFTMTNGIEGSWTQDPTKWDNSYLENLFRFEWRKTKSPAGSIQWTPVDPDAPKTPDAHVKGRMNPLMMMTSDIALKEDPAYRAVCERFLHDFDAFSDAFARAWFKLTHRDMGPKVRYLGPEVPAEDLIWQDPIPPLDFTPINDDDAARLKTEVLASGLTVTDLVTVAWAAASTHRVSDKRGGANGGRIRLQPQRGWAVNEPERLERVIPKLEEIAERFNAAGNGRHVSFADMVVLAGCAAVEQAARDAGTPVAVPFVAGRRDTTQELTDVEQFNWLQPVSDGFRNYQDDTIDIRVSPEELYLDRAMLLSLSAPEWTVLHGGLKALGLAYGGSRHGILTDRPGVLTNDVFRNLTSMDTVWSPVDGASRIFEGREREGGAPRFTATRCDLVFGSNSQLREIAEVYASDDAGERFVRDFVAAWHKVMMLDRYDVAK